MKGPNLDPATERYLRLSQTVLKYAEGLGMKTGASYRAYIGLPPGRDWVTQVVVAARRDRLESHLFNYPLYGGLPYKGFYDEADAAKLEQSLKDDGYDVIRRKVPAFSTTGWMPDPILSTMFRGEGDFIELLLHELVHANFYFPGEADFNEAFASWFAYRMSQEFVTNTPAGLNLNRDKVLAELAEDHAVQADLAAAMTRIIAEGRKRYAEAKEPLAVRDSYFAWIREYLGQQPRLKAMAERPWNNALILSFGTYYAHVDAIERYARERRFTPPRLLEKVVSEGPKIVREILSGTRT